MAVHQLISIIIPARNAESHIRACLDSVLLASQDVSIEVILVINGCSDETAEFANRYCAILNMRAYVYATALGPAAARNIGIRMAKGSWLYFLDADDLIPEGALARHREFMSSTRADVLVGAYIRVASESLRSSHLLPGAQKFDTANIREYILKYVNEPYLYTMPVHCWGKLYSRYSVLSAGILFDESLDQLEDVNFNFSLILRGLSFEYTDEILYQYHINLSPNSLSTQSGDAPNSLQRVQVAYMPIRLLLERWEASGAITDSAAHLKHLFATTSLLWLIRAGRRFGGRNWQSCKILVDQIVGNPDLRAAMTCYREMPGTSRVIPYLVKLNLPHLLCIYFKINAMWKKFSLQLRLKIFNS